MKAVPKVMSKSKKVIQKEKMKLSLTEGIKERKSKLVASNKFLEETFLSLRDTEGTGSTEKMVCQELNQKIRREGKGKKGEARAKTLASSRRQKSPERPT